MKWNPQLVQKVFNQPLNKLDDTTLSSLRDYLEALPRGHRHLIDVYAAIDHRMCRWQPTSKIDRRLATRRFDCHTDV